MICYAREYFFFFFFCKKKRKTDAQVQTELAHLAKRDSSKHVTKDQAVF
jgi:hypothetical protein